MIEVVDRLLPLCMDEKRKSIWIMMNLFVGPQLRLLIINWKIKGLNEITSHGMVLPNGWLLFCFFTNQSDSLSASSGSIVRKQWLKSPHRWLILSAILIFIPSRFIIKQYFTGHYSFVINLSKSYCIKNPYFHQTFTLKL